MDDKSASRTRVLGLSLEQYAGIQTALLQGFPLEQVLKNERLSNARWSRARAAWGNKLAKDGHAGRLAAALREKSAEAAAWLGRRVAPLEDDLQAWCAFLGAYAAEEAPAELLARLGMRDTDVQRLVFTWKAKTDGDPELAKKAAELTASMLRGIPSVRVTEGKLRPFPWSPGPEPERGAAPAPPAPDMASPASAGGGASGPRALEVPSFLKVPPVLTQSAPMGPVAEPHKPAPAAPPKAGIGETVAVFSLPLPASAALPFNPGARDAPAAASTTGTPSAPASPPATPSDTGADPPKGGGLSTGTALAFDLPKRPDLPFPSRASAKIDNPVSGSELAALARAIAARAAKSPPASPATPGAPPPSAAEAPAPANPAAPPAPANPAAPPPLTLEQHASLCAELAFRPDERAGILARYRVTEETTLALTRQYQDRPERKAAWETAYRTYFEWLASQAQGRQNP